MAGEDQERFEDYLELEQYIDGLQTSGSVHPPKDLTASQLRIYRMAALFRSVSPEAAEPRPEFVQELRARLLSLDQEHDEEETLKLPSVQIAASQKEVQKKQSVPQPSAAAAKEGSKKMHFFSRRSLLAGGAVAAASLAVGVGFGSNLQSYQSTEPPVPATGTPLPSYANTTNIPLVPTDVPTTWHFVTTVAQLGNQAMKFTADTLVGYVILNDGDSNADDPDSDDKGKIIAMSAACTHMGCIVQWQNADRHFHCPCHGGMFNLVGNPATGGRLRYLTPLPRLTTKVVNGEIYVQVPVSAKNGNISNEYKE